MILSLAKKSLKNARQNPNLGYNRDMSTTTDYRTDPAYKYAFAYGVLSHCMTVIEKCVERAKREGVQIDPNDSNLKWVIAQYKATDDVLHAEKKN